MELSIKLDNGLIPKSSDSSRNKLEQGSFVDYLQQQYIKIDVQQKREKQQNSSPKIEVRQRHQQSQIVGTLDSIFKRLRLKIVSKLMLNNTNSRMLKNLKPFQYYLINDKSNVSNIKQKNLMLSLQNSLNSTNPYNIIQIDAQQQDEIQESPNYIENIKQILINNKIIQNIINHSKSIPIFKPSSFFKLLWEFVLMVFITFCIIYIPIIIAFDMPFSVIIPDWLTQIISTSLVIDLLINMNTAYFDKGVLVNKRLLIFTNYIQSHFFIDAISSFTLIIYYYKTRFDTDWCYYHEQLEKCAFNHYGKFLLILFLIKLNKFKQTIQKLQDRYHFLHKFDLVIQLIKLLFTIIIIAHFIACIWILFAKIENHYSTQSWIDALKLDTYSWFTLYIRSYYFTAITMITVGYGDIVPKNDQEMILSIIIIMISCGVYAYSINEIGQIFNSLQKKEKENQQNMLIINNYMYSKSINQHLQYQVRKYLDFYWNESRDRDQQSEQKIIGQLSDQLKEKLLIEANKIVLKDSPIFSDNFSDRLIYRTIPLIQEYRFNPEEIITRGGEENDFCIYFIEKGSVDAYIVQKLPGQQDKVFILQTLGQGEYFGAENFFTGQNSQINIRSREFTTLQIIKREQFLQLLKDFPDDYEQFCCIKDNILYNQNYDQIGVKCYSCQSSKHQIINCPFLHYISNRPKILTQFNKISNFQNRQQINRGNNFPKKKFNSLINYFYYNDSLKDYQEENEELLNYYQSIVPLQYNQCFYEDEELNNTSINSQQNILADQKELPGQAQTPRKKSIIKQSSQRMIQFQDQNTFNFSASQIESCNQDNQIGQQQLPRKSLSLDLSFNEIEKLQEKNQGNNFQLQQVADLFNKQKKKNNQSIAQNNKTNSPILKNHITNSRNKIIIDQFVQNLNEILTNNTQSNKESFIDQQYDISQNFDSMKNFAYYLPFNNFAYQQQLMQLENQERKFLLYRAHLDNFLHYRKSLAIKKSSQQQMYQYLNKIKQKQIQLDDNNKEENQKNDNKDLDQGQNNIISQNLLEFQCSRTLRTITKKSNKITKTNMTKNQISTQQQFNFTLSNLENIEEKPEKNNVQINNFNDVQKQFCQIFNRDLVTIDQNQQQCYDDQSEDI